MKILKKYKKLIIKYAIHPIAVATVLFVGLSVSLFLRIIRPLAYIRIYFVFGSRIGQLSGDLERYLCWHEITKSVEKPILVADGVSNAQLFNMYGRLVPLIRSTALSSAIKIYAEYFKNSKTISLLPLHVVDPYKYIAASKPHLKFTLQELARGEELLRRLGVPKGAEYVCFQNRDPAYLKYKGMGRDFSYHDYRDSKIDDYVPAVEALAERGYYCVRLGSIVEHELPKGNSRIIDHTGDKRADFDEIYLSAHCKFFFGTNSGLTFAAGVSFGVPLVFSNMAPIGFMPLRPRDIVLPKKYYSKKLDRILTYREVVECRGHDLWVSKDYESRGIQLMNNTTEELREAALEMSDKVRGAWQEHPEDELLHALYQRIWPDNHIMNECVSKISTTFLRRNRNLLDKSF